jgi:CDP-L-myo-inositol myo-inositolphosphotransferase
MKDGTVRQAAVVEFATAQDAQRLIAGLPALARITRELAAAGYADLWVVVSSGEALGQATLFEVRRLAGNLTVHTTALPPDAEATRFPPDRLIAANAVPDYLAGKAYRFLALSEPGATAEILRHTGKPSDGIVSRTINRALSRRISAGLLRAPGIRPLHATICTALIAAMMFAALVFGGRDGLIAGAWLFYAASVFDGVDGEIARATFRTTRKGAALDSAVDAATNVGAMLGMAVNLAARGDREALPLVAWGLSLFVIGLTMIGRHSLRADGGIGFDVVKQRYRGRFTGSLATRLMRLATLGTSRDFCALVYVLLVVAGIPIAGLYLFAVVTPVWLVFVAAALWSDGSIVPRKVAE